MSIRFPRWIFPIFGAVTATIGIALVLAYLAGFWHEKVPRSEAVPALPVRSGETVEVQSRVLPLVESAMGVVKPVHQADVAAKILARVVDMKVTAGKVVSQGEILVQLDNADFQSRLKQTASALEAATASHENARLEFERAKPLLERSAISRSEFDRIQAAMRTTKAEVDRAREANAESAIVAEFATIRSPIAGIVIEKRVESGDMVTPGQVLVTVYDPNHMQLVASVRESIALKLKVGDEIPARLDALGHECSATIREIVPEAESTTRSFTVKASGPCPPGVYGGMFGRLLLPIGQEEVLLVPEIAVRRIGQVATADVVKGERTQRRTIQTGRRFGGDLEVLAGLRAGERVLLPAGSK